jgi:hypothetical protein
MIKHYSARTAKLDLHPADEGHIGEMVNRWRHCYVNRLTEVGFSDFSGDMFMPAVDGYFGMLVITGGSGELHENGSVTSFERGDVLVYEPPVGNQRLVSDGCTYVYMTQWGSEEARDALSATLADPVIE